MIIFKINISSVFLHLAFGMCSKQDRSDHIQWRIPLIWYQNSYRQSTKYIKCNFFFFCLVVELTSRLWEVPKWATERRHPLRGHLVDVIREELLKGLAIVSLLLYKLLNDVYRVMACVCIMLWKFPPSLFFQRNALPRIFFFYIIRYLSNNNEISSPKTSFKVV